MDINDAEKFVYAWGMWERGRSDGIALAIQMVEKLLCGEGTTEGQREILVGLYNSLREAKNHRSYP
jgi:hypothetical protein